MKRKAGNVEVWSHPLAEKLKLHFVSRRANTTNKRCTQIHNSKIWLMEAPKSLRHAGI